MKTDKPIKLSREYKKALLGAYKGYSGDIEKALLEYEKVFTAATHITQDIRPTPGGGGPSGSKLENYVIRLAEITASMGKGARDQLYARERTNRMIGALKKPQYRLVLTLRYMDGMSIKTISGTIGTEPDNVKKLIARAVDAIPDEVCY